MSCWKSRSRAALSSSAAPARSAGSRPPASSRPWCWCGSARSASPRRIERIVAENAARAEEPRAGARDRSRSARSTRSACLRGASNRLDPKVVLLVGCRIVKPEILVAIPLPGAQLSRRHHPAISRHEWRLLGARVRRRRAISARPCIWSTRRRHRRHPLPGARQAGAGRQHHDLHASAGGDVARHVRPARSATRSTAS